jgi:hypothetical protein
MLTVLGESDSDVDVLVGIDPGGHLLVCHSLKTASLADGGHARSRLVGREDRDCEEVLLDQAPIRSLSVRPARRN